MQHYPFLNRQGHLSRFTFFQEAKYSAGAAFRRSEGGQQWQHQDDPHDDRQELEDNKRSST